VRSKEDWHRGAVGGMWSVIGKLQFEFLVGRGLMPEHFLLDIGCGSLRGGVHFIRYLQPRHYYGFDKEESLIDAGKKIELKKYKLHQKQPQLFVVKDFELPFDRKFDFMLAQSVFTHLIPEQVELCLKKVMANLKELGVFYVTIFEKEGDEPFIGRRHNWRKGEVGTVKYSYSRMQQFANKLGISVEYIGHWKHPRKQKMIAFRKGYQL